MEQIIGLGHQQVLLVPKVLKEQQVLKELKDQQVLKVL
jgi:hypothetical protein